jgi:hypothetical protein
MNGPTRLLDSSSNPAARDLLRAGVAERPRSAARRSTALALGLSASAIAASTTTAAAATVVTASAATVALKSLAVGTLVGLALAGGAAVVSDVTRARPAIVSAPKPSPEARAPELAPVVASESVPAPVANPSATPPRPSKRVVEVTAPTPSAPASASLPEGQSLSREIALIDGARRALIAGDVDGALAQLQDYDGRLRTGTLDREAQLLRIDALARAGQRGAARALAQRYLESYPSDPHAARLRALVGTEWIDSSGSRQDPSGGRP